MRLYPKKLRNIDDLEREKKLLRKESKRMEEEGFLSIDGIFNKKQGKGRGDEASLFDFLPISNPLVAHLIKLLGQRFFGKDNNSKADSATEQNIDRKRARSKLKQITIEIIGGYLKWKAIELSYKGIRHLIKKRREKKAVEQ